MDPTNHKRLDAMAGRFSCLDRFSLELIRATSHDSQFPSTRAISTTYLAIDIRDLCGSTAMGFWDTITDLVDAATPWSTVEAEAPISGAAGAGPAKESAVRHPPCSFDFA
jgi:hypothetical protein